MIVLKFHFPLIVSENTRYLSVREIGISISTKKLTWVLNLENRIRFLILGASLRKCPTSICTKNCAKKNFSFQFRSLSVATSWAILIRIVLLLLHRLRNKQKFYIRTSLVVIYDTHLLYCSSSITQKLSAK